MSKKNSNRRVKPYPGAIKVTESSSDSPSFVEGNGGGKGFLRDLMSRPWLLPVIYGVVFTIAAYVILLQHESEHLFYAQENCFWADTNEFWQQKTAIVGGWLQWTGCYLTQYFYHPAIGVSILIILWLTTVFLLLRAFRLHAGFSILAFVPVVALLVSEVDLGYWVYYFKHPGYWFSNSVGLLVVSAGLWAARLCARRYWLFWAWLGAWGFLTYPLLGWYSLLGLICMSLTALHWIKGATWQKLSPIAVGAVVFYFAPLVAYNNHEQMRLTDRYLAGFPFFESDTQVSPTLSYPFYIIAAVLIFTALMQGIPSFVRSLRRNQCELACGCPVNTQTRGFRVAAIITNIALLIALPLFVNSFWYRDHNYHAELRQKRAIEEERWADAEAEMSYEKLGDIKPTRQMIIAKNIALIKQDKLSERLFTYRYDSKMPEVFDTLDVRLVQTAAPMIYYHHARLNFCTRWCMENAVEFGVTVEEYKYMAKCALINHEGKLAKKYLDILSHTTFHKPFAEKYLAYLDADGNVIDAKIQGDADMREVCELMDDENLLDSDGSFCETYLINFFANSTSHKKKLSDVIMAYNCINKDIQLFWPRFFKYAILHKGEPMPIAYQEAAFLYGQLEPGNVDITHMPFDKEKVVERYGRFNASSHRLQQMFRPSRPGLTQEETNAEMEAFLADQMRVEFGDTFWYFYFLCRGIKSY